MRQGISVAALLMWVAEPLIILARVFIPPCKPLDTEYHQGQQQDEKDATIQKPSVLSQHGQHLNATLDSVTDSAVAQARSLRR